MSGLEVCQRLRASPQLAHVPIVILSATTGVTDFSSAQRLGAVMFAPKPFKAQKLLNHVRMLLEH
ncbi:MAG: response regulator [Terriglobia bacterium]